MSKSENLRCSFCWKKETEVSKLVAGPQVYICDGCIEIARSIVDDSPINNQPPKGQSSVWRKLLSHVRQIWRGGDAQRIGSFGTLN